MDFRYTKLSLRKPDAGKLLEIIQASAVLFSSCAMWLGPSVGVIPLPGDEYPASKSQHEGLDRDRVRISLVFRRISAVLRACKY